jgi:thiamine kinase-like enzyme
VPITAEVYEIATRVPKWEHADLAIEPLPGGLTNHNFRVDVGGDSFVLRIPGPRTELLAVDRDNEYHNAAAAWRAGVSPRILHRIEGLDGMVIEYIPGETMSAARLSEPGMPDRIAKALRRLHAGPRFLLDFDMFRLTGRYLGVARELGIALPEGYESFLPSVGEIERAFARHPLPTVPCHNDLLAENYILEGERLWIIDFEYSGNNDPTFELGNTAQEQLYGEGLQSELCAAYFGEARPGMLARMKLNMIMSDVGWTLWAAIQADISPIDFDFRGWAEERWARARAKMESPEFRGWMDQV